MTSPFTTDTSEGDPIDATTWVKTWHPLKKVAMANLVVTVLLILASTWIIALFRPYGELRAALVWTCVLSAISTTILAVTYGNFTEAGKPRNERNYY